MVYPYTNSELLEMLLIYGECGHNSRAARRRYSEVYPDRTLPSSCTFISLTQRFRDIGFLKPQYRDSGCGRSKTTLKAEAAILEAIENDPTLSMRRLARELKISRSAVWRTLKENRIGNFQRNEIQTLTAEDRSLRVKFCEWILQKHSENSEFLSNIFFTNEASFTREDIFHIDNSYEWTLQDNEGELFHFFINVWVGIIDGFIIGPFFLPESIDEECYLDFIRNLGSAFEDVPLKVRRDMWYQNECTSRHFGRKIRKYLSNEFEDRWIGSKGPIAWPPCSYDLNPINFFYWSCLYELVYKKHISDVYELRHRITATAEVIRRQNLLPAMRDCLIHRALLCVQVDGANFEHLL